MILTITKIVNDLERIGDEIKKIAYKARRRRDATGSRGALPRRDACGRPRSRCCRWRSTRSRASTSTRAVEMIAFDDEIDAAFGSILRQLISYMMEDPRTIGASIEIVFMAKSIERDRRPRQEHRGGGGAGR